MDASNSTHLHCEILALRQGQGVFRLLDHKQFLPEIPLLRRLDLDQTSAVSVLHAYYRHEKA